MTRDNSEPQEKVSGKHVCTIHGIEMRSQIEDVPIFDENGEATYDENGNLVTERTEVYHCDECGAEIDATS